MLVNVAIVLATFRQVMAGVGNGKRIIAGMLPVKNVTQPRRQSVKKNASNPKGGL
jgi:hypothetical protein